MHRLLGIASKLAACRIVYAVPLAARALAHFAFAVAGVGWGLGFGRVLGLRQGDLDHHHNHRGLVPG